MIVLAVACYFIIKYSVPCTCYLCVALILIIVIAFIACRWIPRNPACQKWVFWFGVGIILAFILGSTYITSGSSTKAPTVFVPCEEQKTYAIESIKIHTDFVHGLTQGILLARQAFFVVITGLLLYYFVKNGENKLKKETLLLFVLSAAIFCHLHEGINDYWQSEHLNRIYSLTESLDKAMFPGSKPPKVFVYEELPKGPPIFSVFVYTYSLRLNTNSILFYFGILILVFALVSIADRS